jgi:hypothetical protein
MVLLLIFGLPTKLLGRPITPSGHTMFNKVADLIDPITGQWDKELIEEIFWEEDTNISWLSHLDRVGRIPWRGTSMIRGSSLLSQPTMSLLTNV